MRRIYDAVGLRFMAQILGKPLLVIIVYYNNNTLNNK